MQGFTIFVEGADTIQQLRKVPVYFVPEEKYAARICEGMGETEYAQLDFTLEQWTKSDLGKIPAWAAMIEDVRNGVYGDEVANISEMAERMHRFMSGHERGVETPTAPDTETGNAGSTTQAMPADASPELAAGDPVDVDLQPRGTGPELPAGPAAKPQDAAGGGGKTRMISDVFLSYNRDDRPTVDELAEKLRSKQLTVWMDTRSLVKGEHWQNGIAKGIDGSRSFAVCVGAARIERWQKEETQYALNRAATDKRFKVIPVLLPGAPAKPELPFPLGNREWVDFRNRFDPDELQRLVSDIKGATYPTPENFERDKWIFEQRQARRTIPAIQSELETNKHGWEPLYSENGIRDAVERYANHVGEPIPKARPGKPRGR